MRLLTREEIQALNAVHRSGPSSLGPLLAGFSETRKSLVLDSLLAYHKYRFMSGRGIDGPELQELRRAALLARLRLPPGPVPAADLASLPSPADGSYPMARGLAAAAGSGAGPDAFLRLTWSPFKWESVGRNTMEGGELALLDVAVGISPDREALFLDQIDILRVSSLNTTGIPLEGESRLSWQLHAGAVRVDDGGDTAYDGTAGFGVGYAKAWGPGITGYAMTDLAVHTLRPHARLRPHLGLSAHLGGLRTWAYAGAESTDHGGGFHPVWGGKLQLSLGRRLALHAELSSQRATRATLGVELNW